jgi:hypothetical protein
MIAAYSGAGDIVPTATDGDEIDLRTEAFRGKSSDYACAILFLADCAQFDCMLEGSPTTRSFTGLHAPKAGDVRVGRFIRILSSTTSGIAIQVAYP